MPKWNHLSILKLGIALLLGAAHVCAQKPASKFEPLSDPVMDRLHRAELATTLTREGVHPFYLKIDAQLYDAKGKPSEKGTVEDWWAGDATEKTIFTMPSYTATQVRKGDEIFRSANASSPPELLRLLLEQVTDPMPPFSALGPLKTTQRAVKQGAALLDCALVELASVPPDFCFEPGKDSLRVIARYGTEVIIRNSIGTFQNKEVPLDVTIRIGGVLAVTGHISALMTREVPVAELSTGGLPDKVFEVPQHAGKLIHKVDTRYPEEAKRQHIAGVVGFRILIGTDGHVRDIRIIGATSPILVDAARTAVSQWVYEPFEVDGKPQVVETSVWVNFTFG